MTYSNVSYVGNGVTTTFSVPFPYISQSHVSAKINGSAVSFTWPTAATVSLTPAPASGAAVLIQRVTPITSASVVFNDGGTLTASDLNTSILQELYAAQEATDIRVAQWAGFFKTENLTVAANGSLSATTFAPNSNFIALTIQGQTFLGSSGAFSVSGTALTWNSGPVGWSLQPGWQVSISYTYNPV